MATVARIPTTWTRFEQPARNVAAVAIVAALLAGVGTIPDYARAADYGRAGLGATSAAAGVGGTERAESNQPIPCPVAADKIASPTSITLGQEVTVRLTLAAACSAEESKPTEIVLAIDRSTSMNEQGRFPASIAAAEMFLGLVDFPTVRVGLVTYSEGGIFDPQATIQLPLSDDPVQVLQSLRGLAAPPDNTLWTNLTAGLETSASVLEAARPDTRRVIILLTDGNHNALPPFVGDPEEAAEAIRADGILIFTIGLSVDQAAADRLIAIAGSPDRYFPAPSPSDLEAVYRAVALAVASTGVADVEVVDEIPSNMRLVAGSVTPAADQSVAGRLVWRTSRVGGAGWSATYRLRPLEAGTHPTNVSAYADYTDVDATRRRADFPVPSVTVTSPEAYQAYLPATFNRYCRPERPFDVILAVDGSSSMDGDKAVRAREAAIAFLRMLSMPPTQAGVLSFHDDAQVVQELTTDRRLAESALVGLPSGTGTRIDRALDRALEELTSARHAADNLPVVVLLTDGRQTGAPENTAVEAAQRVRDAGTTIFTVGIGSDVSRPLLEAVAGDPSRYYAASGPDELRSIYVRIAGSLPCSP